MKLIHLIVVRNSYYSVVIDGRAHNHVKGASYARLGCLARLYAVRQFSYFVGNDHHFVYICEFKKDQVCYG